MKRSLFIILALVAPMVLSLDPVPTQAQVVVIRNEGYDRIGWLGRFTIGGGYHYADGTELDLYGPSLIFSATAGASVSPELTIQGEAWGSVVIGPTVERDIGSELLDTRTTLSAIGVGPGFTFFLEPMGAFVSTSAGFTIVQLEVDGIVEGESHLGWGTHVMVGKDWWISPYYSAGLTLNFMFQMNRDSGGWLSTYAGGLSFVVARM